MLFGRLLPLTVSHGSALADIRTNSLNCYKSDRIEELTKLKDLLDGGAITQEEFDAKKKQLLDL